MKLIQVTDDEYEAIQRWQRDRTDVLAQYVNAEGEITNMYAYDEARTDFGDGAYELLQTIGTAIDLDLVDALSWLGTICQEWDNDEMLSDQGRREIGDLLMRALKLAEYPFPPAVGPDSYDDEVERYFAGDQAVRERLNEMAS